MTFFALKKCGNLHIKNLTRNRNNADIKLLMSIVPMSKILPSFLKYEIKKWGQCRIFRDMGQADL